MKSRKKIQRPPAADYLKQQEHKLTVMRKGFEPFYKKLFVKMCKGCGVSCRVADIKMEWPRVDPLKDKPARKRKKKK